MDPIIDAFIDILRPIGITEIVFQFMLVNAILGVSIYLTLYAGMFSLANAGFMAIGAYIGVLVTTQLELPLFAGLIIGMVGAGLIAKFGVAFWALTAVAVAAQVAMIVLVFALNRRHFARRAGGHAVPAE